MASNHAEACAAMRPGCTDEGVCDCGYLDSVMREGYQQDYSTPPPAERCPVCRYPDGLHAPVCEPKSAEPAVNPQGDNRVTQLDGVNGSSILPSSTPGYTRVANEPPKSYTHVADSAQENSVCTPVSDKPAAAEVRVEDLIAYAKEISEPPHWESHRVIKQLLTAYDAVCAQLRKANEWAYSLESQVSALKAERDELEDALGKAAIELGAPPNGLRIVVEKLTRELDTTDKAFIERSAERDEARAECERLRAACKRNPSSGSCIDALEAGEK